MVVRALILGVCGYTLAVITGPLSLGQMLASSVVAGIIYATGMYAGDHAIRELLLSQTETESDV